jgi:AP-3 complex subunit beta
MRPINWSSWLNVWIWNLTTIMSATLQLSSFSENASRLGMRIQESFNEALTRDFGSSTAALFDGAEDKLIDIRKQLDSSSDKEKMDALRRLIAVH